MHALRRWKRNYPRQRVEMSRATLFALFCGVGLTALAHAQSIHAPQPSSRFALSGVISEVPATAKRSPDGRFALSAQLRMSAERSSADGRFALKSTQSAGCDPSTDLIFANGFQLP